MAKELARTFLTSHGHTNDTTGLSACELLVQLGEANLPSEAKAFQLCVVGQLLSELQEYKEAPQAIPDLEWLIRVIGDCIREGLTHVAVDICSLLLSLQATPHSSLITPGIVAGCVSALSGVKDRTMSSHTLLKAYLESADKGIFHAGVKIAQEAYSIQKMIQENHPLLSTIQVGSLRHQADLTSYLHITSDVTANLRRIDTLGRFHNGYTSALRKTYQRLIQDILQESEGKLNANELTKSVHEKLLKHLFVGIISPLQLEFVSDLLALLSHQCRTDALFHYLLDVAIELKGLTETYGKVAWPSADPTNLELTIPMQTFCQEQDGIFASLLMRLAVCVYKIEILICRRNTSVRYNRVFQTDLTRAINGAPLDRNERLNTLASGKDALPALRLYKDLRPMQKTVLRK
ncbi:hypothetical protein GMRT_11075 [Giardia muris]|uniref:Uncharacterized protein n=1 Tax=Giardia muris TaxID=5742 RepID=A0A4Z1SWI1_GIAMU|nr:hypothetical protein GMRT_11075 [Giardia muris]|eukprot:TNJ30124.1 hypothetical protein GMRT_11075 [Giardia muris]